MIPFFKEISHTSILRRSNSRQTLKSKSDIAGKNTRKESRKPRRLWKWKRRH